MAAGNKHLSYKETLNEMELRSPGIKADFYLGFLARAAERFVDDDAESSLGTCTTCGGPAESELCAFCRLVERTAGAEPAIIELGATRSRQTNEQTDQRDQTVGAE